MRRGEQIRYDQLNAELLDTFPDLFSGYAQLKAMWDGDEPGPHVVYEDLLVPHLVELLTSSTGEVARVSAFSFLEQLARSDDRQVRDLLGASVLEGLLAHGGAAQVARSYMGQCTRHLADAIEQARED